MKYTWHTTPSSSVKVLIKQATGFNINSQSTEVLKEDKTYSFGYKIDVSNYTDDFAVKMYYGNKYNSLSKVLEVLKASGGGWTAGTLQTPYEDFGVYPQDVDGFINVETVVTMTPQPASAFEAQADEIVNYTAQSAVTTNSLSLATHSISFKLKDGTSVSKIYKELIETKQSGNYLNAMLGGFYLEQCSYSTFTQDEYILLDDVCIKEAESYTITFDPNGGTFTDTSLELTDGKYVATVMGSSVELPEITVADETQALLGWYYMDNGVEKEFNGSGITGDMEVYAKYSAEYTVTFDSMGGSEVAAISTTTGSITLPTAPTKTGYSFDGWYTTDGVAFDGTSVTADITVYAKWDSRLYIANFETDKYDTDYATVDTNGVWSNERVLVDGNYVMEYSRTETSGTNDTILNVAFDTKLDSDDSTVEKPTLEDNVTYEMGYMIDFNDYQGSLATEWAMTGGAYGGTQKWYVIDLPFNDDVVIGATKTNGAITSYVHKVAPEAVDGFMTVKTVMKYERQPVSVFESYSADIINWDSVSESTKLYAMAEHFVSYKNSDNEQINVSYKELICTCQATTDSDARFIANQISSMTFSDSKYATNATDSFYLDEVYVMTVESYNVTFDAVDGTFADGSTTATVTSAGSSISLPTAPEKAGYGFLGWVTADGVAFDGTTVTGDITVYAEYGETFTVTFDSNGGSEVASISTATGSITMPENPTRDGYRFDGWYTTDGNVFDGTNITADVTVKARWDSYAYREDFEDGYYDSKYDVVVSGGEQRWSNRLTSEGYMEYIVNGDVTKVRDGDTSNLTILNVVYTGGSFEGNGEVPLSADNKYEAGFRLAPNDFTGKIENIQLTLGGTYNWTYGTLGAISLVNGKLTDPVLGIEEDIANIEGFVSVRAIFDITQNYVADLGDAAKETVNYEALAEDETNKYSIAEIFISYSRKDATIGGGSYKMLIKTADTQHADRLKGIVNIREDFYGNAISGTQSFYLDDIYVKTVETYQVTFNPQGGEFAGYDVDEDGNYVVDAFAGVIEDTIPEPTKDGYTFAGWYTDSTCLTKFEGSMVDDNTTIYARWQTTPTVEKVEKIQDSFVITFSSEMVLTDEDYDIADCIYMIGNGGTIVATTEYTVTSSLVDGKTVLTIKPNGDFTVGVTYVICVTTDAKNLHGTMAEEYMAEITIGMPKLAISNAKAYKADGVTELTNLADEKNTTIKVKFNISTADSSTEYEPIINILSDAE